MNDSFTVGFEFPQRPLCSAYRFVLFEAFPLEIQIDDVALEQTALWAVGVQDDGQCEAAGVWATRSPSADWPVVFDNLAARGVEQIHFVANADTTDLKSFLAGGHFNGAVKPQVLDRRCVSSCSPKHRRVLAAAETFSAMLSRYAVRAIRRHGRFSSIEDAVAFLSASLDSAEQMLDSRWPTCDVGSRSHSTVREAVPVRLGRAV